MKELNGSSKKSGFKVLGWIVFILVMLGIPGWFGYMHGEKIYLQGKEVTYEASFWVPQHFMVIDRSQVPVSLNTHRLPFEEFKNAFGTNFGWAVLHRAYPVYIVQCGSVYFSASSAPPLYSESEDFQGSAYESKNTPHCMRVVSVTKGESLGSVKIVAERVWFALLEESLFDGFQKGILLDIVICILLALFWVALESRNPTDVPTIEAKTTLSDPASSGS